MDLMLLTRFSAWMIGASSANPLPAAAAAIVLVSSSSERRRSRPGNGNSLHKNPQE
jgi:hypothetical protein